MFTADDHQIFSFFFVVFFFFPDQQRSPDLFLVWSTLCSDVSSSSFTPPIRLNPDFSQFSFLRKTSQPPREGCNLWQPAVSCPADWSAVLKSAVCSSHRKWPQHHNRSTLLSRVGWRDIWITLHPQRPDQSLHPSVIHPSALLHFQLSHQTDGTKRS